MAGKIAKIIEDAVEKPPIPVQRLCNEIQLFDLCERERCNHKQGLYCTSTELLNRFEAIADEEERPAEGFISGEMDDTEDADEEVYEDTFDEDYDENGDDSEYEEEE